MAFSQPPLGVILFNFNRSAERGASPAAPLRLGGAVGGMRILEQIVSVRPQRRCAASAVSPIVGVLAGWLAKVQEDDLVPGGRQRFRRRARQGAVEALRLGVGMKRMVLLFRPDLYSDSRRKVPESAALRHRLQIVSPAAPMTPEGNGALP